MRPWVIVLLLFGLLVPASASAELFDFDSAPQYSPLPIDQTVGAITAHFSYSSTSGGGYSIQSAGALGFTPAGFSGLCIYPSAIYAADLLIGFSVPLTDFSILYAPEEYGCGDGSATMRVTAYMSGVYRGTATTTAPVPGTWPTGTLSYSDANGFDQVVVHYDQPSPLCTDYGPIFMVDNMTVTMSTASAPAIAAAGPAWIVAPNPFRAATRVTLRLARAERLTVTIHDVAGRVVRTLARGTTFEAGAPSLDWDGRDDAGGELKSGVYFCRVASARGARTTPVILRR